MRKLVLNGEVDEASEISKDTSRLFTTQLDASKKVVQLSDAELAMVGGAGGPCGWLPCEA